MPERVGNIAEEGDKIGATTFQKGSPMTPKTQARADAIRAELDGKPASIQLAILHMRVAELLAIIDGLEQSRSSGVRK